MYIRKSRYEDLEEIILLYDLARNFMRKNGNPNQWNNSYPKPDMIKNDIKNGRSYVCIDEIDDNKNKKEKIVATFIYFIGKEPYYNYIEDGKWPDDNEYGVVHRITALEGTHGVGAFCLKYAYDNADSRLRIDTHKDNIPMQRLLAKEGFVYCGNIYVEDGSKRMAYYKQHTG